MAVLSLRLWSKSFPKLQGKVELVRDSAFLQNKQPGFSWLESNFRPLDKLLQSLEYPSAAWYRGCGDCEVGKVGSDGEGPLHSTSAALTKMFMARAKMVPVVSPRAPYWAQQSSPFTCYP